MFLQFHKTDKIVVDFNVTLIVPIDRLTLSDLNALYQPQKGRPVQFFQLGVIPDEDQPVISGLLISLTDIQLCGQFCPLSRLIHAFILISLQQLVAYRLWDRTLYLILAGGDHQFFQFRKSFIQCVHGSLECFLLFQPGSVLLGHNLLFESIGLILRQSRLETDVNQQQFDQYPLIDNVARASSLSAGDIAVAGVALVP